MFKDLLENIKDFFMSIFFPSAPEYRIKRSLKNAELEIKKIHPSIYKSHGFVLPGFATIILQLYQQVLPLKKLLSASLASKDVRLYSKYSSLIIEQSFTSEPVS